MCLHAILCYLQQFQIVNGILTSTRETTPAAQRPGISGCLRGGPPRWQVQSDLLATDTWKSQTSAGRFRGAKLDPSGIIWV